MIIPCIDLMGGVVVQLVQGERKALEAGPPFAMLSRFAQFPEIQVIDLDAAMGTGTNETIVAQLAGKARLRVGGGIRTLEKARRIADLGVAQIIVGTAAFNASGINHAFLDELAQAVGPSRLTIALDSRNGRIVVKGWRSALKISAQDVLKELEPYCRGFLCTYVDKEGMMQGTDLEWFRSLRAITERAITAAGGVTTYEDVAALLQMNVEVAIGMAVYTGRLSLDRLAALSREAKLRCDAAPEGKDPLSS